MAGYAADTAQKEPVAVSCCGRGGDTGPQIVARPPDLAGTQIVPRHPNLAVLLTHCDQLILLRNISKFDAARRQILQLKFAKFDFRARGAYSAPHTAFTETVMV